EGGTGREGTSGIGHAGLLRLRPASAHSAPKEGSCSSHCSQGGAALPADRRRPATPTMNIITIVRTSTSTEKLISGFRGSFRIRGLEQKGLTRSQRSQRNKTPLTPLTPCETSVQGWSF